MTRLMGLLAVILILTASGCGHRDAFPMHNPETGQDVVCHSGEYWFDEGMPQMRLTTACISACEAHGFRRHTGNPYADEPHPAPAPDDLKSEIPPACLP